MFIIQNFATNAANPHWNISTVDYTWSRETAKSHPRKNRFFGRKKNNIKMNAQEEAFRFELHKPFQNNDNNIFGSKKQKEITLCKANTIQDNKDLSA